VKYAQKPQEKRKLGKRRSRREDNINTDLTEIWCEFVDWIQPAQNSDFLST